MQAIAEFFNVAVEVIEGVLMFIAAILGIALLACFWPNAWHAWGWTGEFWVSMVVLIFIIILLEMEKHLHAWILILLFVIGFIVIVCRNYPSSPDSNKTAQSSKPIPASYDTTLTLRIGDTYTVAVPYGYTYNCPNVDHPYCYRGCEKNAWSKWEPIGEGLPDIGSGQYVTYFELKADEEEVTVTVTFTKK